MNATSDLTAFSALLLLKWTGLLALAWCAHGLLRARDARWRLILWRSVLGFSLLLPFLQRMDLPGIEVPPRLDLSHWESPARLTTEVAPRGTASPPLTAAAGSTTATPTKPRVPINPVSAVPPPVRQPIFGLELLFLLWGIGCFTGVIRLARLQWGLTRLRRCSAMPQAELQPLVAQAHRALDLPREIPIRTTGAISSPLVCNLFHPTILLPQRLVETLTPAELRAVLLHELAHVRRHDLVWCVAWQWFQALAWFHPLIWRVPAAHTLACEQEADRAASAQTPAGDSYRQLLARLAFKVLALPAVETRLAVNGSAQITERLRWLAQHRPTTWNWRCSVAAGSLSLLLFLAVAGCKTASTASAATAGSANVEMKRVLVVVQDEAGQPIAGATISHVGFRVKGIHGADAYSWRADLFGPAETVVTDGVGKAAVKYPVMGIPEEKERTGKIFFSVTHPEYATARPQEYSVDSPEQPIHLKRGIRLKVSGYVGSDHQVVPELVPMINEEGIQAEDWQASEDHGYAFNKLSAGAHLLRLMGRLASGQVVYSDVQEFTAEPGKDYHLAVKMKPGIRVEGRLDARTPRPVVNGRVVVSVRPPQFPAWTNWDQVGPIFDKYAHFSNWKTYRPIAPDGTFVFEALPPGELDLIVHGDGFASRNGGFYARNFGVPQAFVLNAPTTRIEVATEPTATLEFTARTRQGKPIEGVWVGLNPNVIRIGGGLFGDIGQSSEAPFQTFALLPEVPYSAKTDPDGVVIIRNVPACTGGLDVEHPHYQVPLQEPKGWRDRHVRVSFTAGETNRLKLTLEPKGSDYIGARH